MGFWSTLAGIGGDIAKVAPYVAAPFTGGASLALAPAAGAIGGVLSGIGKATGPAAASVASGMAAGRNQENLNKQKAFEDTLEAQKANEANLENRLKLKQSTRNNAYSGALRGALAKNMQDVTIGQGPSLMGGRLPTVAFNGGMRPSAFGSEGRAAGTEMNRQSMLDLMNGTGLPDLPASPTAPDFKNAGVGENVLGTIGAVGTAANAAIGANQQQSYQQQLLKKLQEIEDQNKPPSPSSGMAPPADPGQETPYGSGGF